MKQKNTAPGAEEIVELQQAAVECARRHGLYPVAHPLRLDYMGLKKRLGETPSVQQKIRKQRRATFVELIPPAPAPLDECVIEVESTSGGKMRIQWRSNTPPDWSSLLRAWRDSEKRGFRYKPTCAS